jgi:hypothetical protein
MIFIVVSMFKEVYGNIFNTQTTEEIKLYFQRAAELIQQQ